MKGRGGWKEKGREGLFSEKGVHGGDRPNRKRMLRKKGEGTLSVNN